MRIPKDSPAPSSGVELLARLRNAAEPGRVIPHLGKQGLGFRGLHRWGARNTDRELLGPFSRNTQTGPLIFGNPILTSAVPSLFKEY